MLPFIVKRSVNEVLELVGMRLFLQDLELFKYRELPPGPRTTVE